MYAPTKKITSNYLFPLNSDGRDLRDCTLPQDIKKFLGEVPDFSEELPGEDIFPMFHPYVTVSFWCFYEGYARDVQVAKELSAWLFHWLKESLLLAEISLGNKDWGQLLRC